MLDMNTAKTWQTDSSKSDDTLEIGKRLGRACKGGELFVLSSDLGGGKTTLVKGLAQGLGSKDVVSSPTFTINRVYTCRDNMRLEHFDFYRLNDPGIIAHELAEVVHEADTVIAIEWGDIVSSVLPKDFIEIVIARLSDHEDARHIMITVPESRNYILEALS